MADANTITEYYGFSNMALTSQSILDVFVIQDLIDQEDAEKLKRQFKTNREIENFLVKNKIVTRNTINKAYSIVLKLPYVELSNIKISDELKALIPEKVAQKYGIIPFSLEDGAIRIALSRPADLLVGFRSGLSKILEEKELEVELFITSESDFDECIKQYNKKYKNDSLLKKGRFPVIYLRNQTIASEFIEKIPREFMIKYRIVVFGRNNHGYYLIACEQPDSPVTIKILNFIKQENQIKYEIFATSKADIDFILDKTKTYISEAPKAKKTDAPVTKTEDNHESSDDSGSTKESGQKSGIKSFMDNFRSSAGPELTIDSVEADSTAAKTADPAETVKNATKDQPSDQNKPQSAETKEASEKDSDDTSDHGASESNTDQESAKEEASSDKEGGESVALLDNKNLGDWLDHEIKTDQDLVDFAKGASVPKVVAAIIDYALNNRSSDIHVEPEAKYLRIRCRVDGILRDILKLPVSDHAAFVSRIKIMSKLKIDEMRVPQDGRFDTVFDEREVDVRVSTLPTVHGEKIVMRILDKSQGILSLEDLGMQGSAFDKTIAAIAKPYGIILSTGPTGSGKSTTLYAILNRISMPGVNIVTLEDPVEYEIAGINQCQIKPEIGFTFASGLRSILRQDPNVIMVGEIRDAETATMAVHSALTGHLVLSTLHTNDTAGALPRLTNMGVEPFLITSSINLIIAQRLIRRICPKCKEEYKAPQRLFDQIKAELDKIPEANTKDRARIPAEIKLFHGKGCSECNHGFKGRVGIYEAMTMTPEIEEMATTKRPADEIKNASIKAGMITMKQDGILKAVAGETTIDEVYQAVVTN
ncbi:hypothetical protein COT78_01210 [Candidatus Berkelbacteria bacterium CG10_big_fil_rev_8_21_14_0_10_43_13]|uniref:AAA+ ATPase domain-containing protein n=1 Tax=Candidatus Berkelbacteria bacterium CG10_big_fil_rev_8_21_14_0_10_43_13 TaxID=1974514 RepID=A0A2H0W6Y3_9BACT|nr:MAG: hypothetical protein COT78_01210 [Candidatus Berkelbacteria bacterium CG10_big_fil_rev_8_21_14_0_10_43_13]